MRTTLTLDDDLATRLKELALRQRASFKDTLNEVLRRGLNAQEVTQPAEPFRIEVFRSGFRTGVDPLRLNQLADDLEADDFLESLQEQAAR